MRTAWSLCVVGFLAWAASAQPEWGDEAELRGTTRFYVDASGHREKSALIAAILEELPEPAPIAFVDRDAAQVHLNVITLHPPGEPAFSQIMVFKLINGNGAYRLLWPRGDNPAAMQLARPALTGARNFARLWKKYNAELLAGATPLKKAAKSAVAVVCPPSDDTRPENPPRAEEEVLVAATRHVIGKEKRPPGTWFVRVNDHAPSSEQLKALQETLNVKPLEHFRADFEHGQLTDAQTGGPVSGRLCLIRRGVDWDIRELPASLR